MLPRLSRGDDPDALLGDVHERLVADVLHEDLRGLERTIAAKAVTYDFARPVENEPNCSGTFVRL